VYVSQVFQSGFQVPEPWSCHLVADCYMWLNDTGFNKPVLQSICLTTFLLWVSGLWAIHHLVQQGNVWVRGLHLLQLQLPRQCWRAPGALQTRPHGDGRHTKQVVPLWPCLRQGCAGLQVDWAAGSLTVVTTQSKC